MYNKVTILPTLRCNLACPDCFRRSVNKTYDMTWSEFEVAVDAIKHQRGINLVLFSGGEPTLWKYFVDAVAHLKHHTGHKVGVVTNGFKRSAYDYKGVDFIKISNYGATNRYYIYQIKKHFPGKVVVQNPIHVPYPCPQFNHTLPADCACYSNVILKDRVYPCDIMAGREGVIGRPIHTQWQADNVEGLDQLFWSKYCRQCHGNRKVRNRLKLPLIAELAFWDAHSWLFSTRKKHFWLRRIYRKIKR